MQIIKNLKPYWKSVLIIVLLLIVQAYCDLALPDYTSKLIDTGIQNYGIEHCSPLQIPEKAYTVIKGFMDEDDAAVWEKYYEQSDDGIYYMTDDGKDHIDEIDQACMEPMMMSRSLKREVMATSSSWVLSPISAMNMVSKMVKNNATRGHLFSQVFYQESETAGKTPSQKMRPVSVCPVSDIQ